MKIEKKRKPTTDAIEIIVANALNKRVELRFVNANRNPKVA